MLVVMTAMLVVTGASAADRFDGAWAPTGLACDKVFTKRDGHIAFATYRGERASGLIVAGDRVQGARASCRLLSRKEQASGFVAVLACKEEIIFDKVVVHFRFKDDDELVRFDPAVPEVETGFHRCRM
jgi:hypothetical protein